ncbi:hypothetical protein [Desulfotomaculum sp. 1211_IL3151]|uniref:hypothetical protein n=1 Tax=Desulfotomaculum sp. 1211_IL3151 TaxID=3084055 RepID=UPI002FDA4BCE
MRRRLLFLGLGSAIALFIVGICLDSGGPGGKVNYFSSLQVFAQDKKKAFGPETMIREENIFLCGDVEEVARKKVKSLPVNDEKGLNDLYGAQGFNLNYGSNEIVAQRKVDEFCGYHRNFRHLGIHDDKVAIYQGPMGYNQKLLRLEEKMPVQTLSAEYQVKLQQVMDFFQMTPETQAMLRYEFEFQNEDALNAILENLDELQEE